MSGGECDSPPDAFPAGTSVPNGGGRLADSAWSKQQSLLKLEIELDRALARSICRCSPCPGDVWQSILSRCAAALGSGTDEDSTDDAEGEDGNEPT